MLKYAPPLVIAAVLAVFGGCSLPQRDNKFVTLKDYDYGDASHAHFDRKDPVLVLWRSERTHDACQGEMIESLARADSARASGDALGAEAHKESVDKAFQGRAEACTQGRVAILYHGDRVVVTDPTAACGSMAHVRVLQSRYTLQSEEAVAGCVEMESLSDEAGPMERGYWRLAVPQATDGTAAARRVGVGPPEETMLACMVARAALIAEQSSRAAAGAFGAKLEADRLQRSACVHDSPSLQP